MPSISQSIITNVDDKYIETYLKKKGFARSEEERGQELKYWVDNLLSTGKLNVEDLETFLFDELFWGKRKNIHVYRLDAIMNYKYPGDWEPLLKEKYNAENMDFSNILCTVPNREETRKISAVYSEENVKGELVKLRILFACYIQLNGENGYKDSVATVYKGNIIKNLIMDCQSYTKYRPNETTGGIFVSWRRKEELPTGGLTEKLSLFFHAKKQEVNAYGR